MDYQIDYQKYAVNFVLPAMITEDLPHIDGDYLKVILQIFQTPMHHYSSALLSTILELEENKVNAALSYWGKRGLLEVVGAPAQSEPYAVGKGVKPVTAPEIPDDGEISFLLQAAEGIMGRPITSQERNTLLNICTVMNMPADIVVMVIQYCSEIGNCSMFKVEKLCAEWAKDGINTHERAEAKLKQLSEKDSIESNVAKCLRVQGRPLSKSEAKYAHTWVEEWGFKYDMISAAYEITVKNTGGLSLPYLNRVLENWSRIGIRTPDEISKWSWKGNSPDKEASSYSRDELEAYWNKF